MSFKEMITYKKKDEQETLILKKKDGVVWFEFPLLNETGIIRQGFSTRLGGVSRDEFSTMNFASQRGDSLENVIENYRRFTTAVGMDWEHLIMAAQTHTTNVEVITEKQVAAGRDFSGHRPFEDVDGLITNVPGAVLVTSYADCVPLYFVDPVHKAIGLSHSGWRGTVNRMGAVTLAKMKEAYGTDPADVYACIGPSICRDCYEVGEDVAQEFRAAFKEEEHELILTANERGRFQLNLWKCNELILISAGIKREHLAVTNVCTCCNPDLLFSHRYTKGKRGNLCAFLSLRENEV